MSGLVGLVDTDALFAEPGTEQKWWWRVAQSFVGLGAIRILSRIAQSPCFEFIHQMFGIKPPEAVEAREFWLRQESWTEMKRLGTSQEDTSYHKINQGAGPQAILIRTNEEAMAEDYRWKTRATRAEKGTSAAESSGPTQNSTSLSPPADGIETELMRKHIDVTEGTTDKWWMDRWQIEALATSAFNNITLSLSCETLTAAYFGKPVNQFSYVILLTILVLTTIASIFGGVFTDYAFVFHIVGTTVLGFTVNAVSTLRAWRFAPTSSLENECPLFQNTVPKELRDSAAVRVAVQNSGMFQLLGCFLLPAKKVEVAIKGAKEKRGRYSIDRQRITYHEPYVQRTTDDLLTSTEDREKHIDSANELDWISYQAQSSYYGLIVAVDTDNVWNRSIGLIVCVFSGFLLLLVGIGSSTPKNSDAYILPIYLILALIAVSSRRRSAVWTMPEFAIVDHTIKNAPPQVRKRWPSTFYPTFENKGSSWDVFFKGHEKVKNIV
ncbi:hypothetical protein HK098_001824 [Nowakowskiella sp. JEL0407]|nr:hypothetical protein HK098_001824 [Nowakowskiella sp. JEL0407]